MAGVCEEAKIVFNVALASTLEERGFERVSDAHYARKETIGEAEVIWRVLFGPPMKYRPMSFRDATGYFIPKVERLSRLAFPDSPSASWTMAGTRHKTFGDTDIADRYERTPKSRKMRRSELKDIEPCFHGLPGTHGLLRPHWNAEGADLEDLGHRIDKYWRSYVDPWIARTNTLFREGPPNRSQFKLGDAPIPLSHIMEDWVLGFKDSVKSCVRGMIESENPTDNEIEQVLRERVRSKSAFRFFSRPKKIPENWYSIFKEGADKDASAARRIAHVLGFEDELPC